MVGGRDHAALIGSNGRLRKRLPVRGEDRIGDRRREHRRAEPADPARRRRRSAISSTSIFGSLVQRRQPERAERRARAACRRRSRARRRSRWPSAWSSPPSTCCRTSPGLTIRPASTAATSRVTLMRWSAPIVASASRPMCEPNAERAGEAHACFPRRRRPSRRCAAAVDQRPRQPRRCRRACRCGTPAARRPRARASSSMKLSVAKAVSASSPPRI